MISEKHFFDGGLNADDDLRALLPNQYLNLENARVGVSEFGRNLRIENIPGTTILTNPYLPTGTNTPIGSTVDLNRQRIIEFNQNSLGSHAIYAYDIATSTWYKVLLSSQITGGLHYSKSFRIDRNAKVIGDLLPYTDGNNEPQCINIERGIKLNHPSYSTTLSPYATPIPYVTTTLIKRPPIFPLQVSRNTDTNFSNNYILNSAYQFTYRYQYKDYQYSVFAAFSALIPYSYKGLTGNSVSTALVFGEDVDDYVQAVELAVRYGNTGKTFIIKRWDKDNTTDAAAIAAHNANSVALSYIFYDDITGIAVDDIAANTSFDNIALRAKTLEIARNRLFFANVLKGYDTPKKTSLTLTVVNTDTGGGSFTGAWGYVTLHANLCNDPGVQDTFMYPFVQGTNGDLYYFSSVRTGTIWNGGLGNVPATINLSEASFHGSTEASLIDFLKNTQYPYSPSGLVPCSPTWQLSYSISYNSMGSVLVVQYAPGGLQAFFKSGSTYEVSIAFYDRFRRKCGIVKKGIKITIPASVYGQTSFSSAIQWALSNTDAVNEIPDWAYYYQIHITKNETTRFFVEAKATNADYVLRNDDGTFSYGHTTVTTATYAVAFNISALTGFGLGYAFAEGDYAKIYMPGNANFNLRVLGQDGNWVLCSPKDLGTLDSTSSMKFELYTPYKPSVTEPYFETGNVYLVSSPTTASRSYSTLTASLTGDVYAIERTDAAAALYIVETMSPNDSVWENWQTDTGWVNYVDTIGQKQKMDDYEFSDTYISGTKTNGLNKFGDTGGNIGSENGAIQKIQLTNKRQEDGTVMLIIAANLPSSMYLGETQIVASAENAFIAKSLGVVGSINSLKNDFGTDHPESVITYNGLVFWFCIKQGVFVQYSVNGLDKVSDYKVARFFGRYSKEYLAMGRANIELINGFSHITTGIDPFHREVFVVLPALIYTNYEAVLPSYTEIPAYASSINNRFDIYDEKAKTLAFKFEENKWGHVYEWLPEWTETINNQLYGFKASQMYLHNADVANYNKVYGTYYPQRLCFVLNNNPSAIRDMLTLAIEGNNIPNFTVVISDYPNQQITDLIDSDYTNKEGVMYADILMDRLSPNIIGSITQKLMEGDPIKGATIMVMMEWQVYNEQLNITFVDGGYEISRGHINILQVTK